MEGDEIARSQMSHGQGYPLIPMGRKDHGGSDPMGGFEPSRCLAFLDTLRTIRHCCRRPLFRRGRQAPKCLGPEQVSIFAFEIMVERPAPSRGRGLIDTKAEQVLRCTLVLSGKRKRREGYVLPKRHMYWIAQYSERNR